MSYGKTAARRRQAARVHATREHECPRCKRVIKGNGYNHKKACIAKEKANEADSR